jgi:hypothetical protein
MQGYPNRTKPNRPNARKWGEKNIIAQGGSKSRVSLSGGVHMESMGAGSQDFP